MRKTFIINHLKTENGKIILTAAKVTYNPLFIG